MSRDLLLLLLGVPLIDVMAFDDDDDPEDGGDDDSKGDPEDDPEDEPEKKKKDDSKKKDDDKSEKKSKSETPEALKNQITELQKKLGQKNKRIATLSRERASLRRDSDSKRKSKTDDDGDNDGDDSETAKLRQTVADLTDRLDNISSENFIEKNVIRKLQPLVAAGLDDDEADRKLNAALRLVDSDEDFDDDGNFDAEAFIKKYPYLAVDPEAKQESARDRLLGGSGKKGKDKKNYAGDALKRFNERRNGNRKAGKAT